jgi:hypothetical protein
VGGYPSGVALWVALYLYRLGGWVGGWVGVFVGDLNYLHKDLAHPFSAGLGLGLLLSGCLTCSVCSANSARSKRWRCVLFLFIIYSLLFVHANLVKGLPHKGLAKVRGYIGGYIGGYKQGYKLTPISAHYVPTPQQVQAPQKPDPISLVALFWCKG